MQDPETYERNRPSTGVDKIVNEYLSFLISHLDWSKTFQGNILDYGCGPGSAGFRYILPKVLQTDSYLYSMDVSEKMLDYARKHYPHDKIKYAVGNILDKEDKFPFQNVKFDKIISCNVFHFFSDLGKALSGLRNILKEGGQLGFICVTAQFPFLQVLKNLQNSATFGEYMKDYDKFYPVWSLNKKESGEEGGLQKCLKSTLEESGFKVSYLEIKRIEFPTTVKSFVEMLLSLNPCMPKIPKDLTMKFKEEAKKLLLEIEGLNASEYEDEDKEFIVESDYVVCLADN